MQRCPEESAARMKILVVDPELQIGPRIESILRSRNWSCTVTREMPRAMTVVSKETPDAVIIHGDGTHGEAAHLCQRFKQNVLTAGMPLILVEDATPPAWMLAGMPADAILQSPWDPAELMQH